jgi:hypothetical protein
VSHVDPQWKIKTSRMKIFEQSLLIKKRWFHLQLLLTLTQKSKIQQKKARVKESNASNFNISSGFTKKL